MSATESNNSSSNSSDIICGNSKINNEGDTAVWVEFTFEKKYQKFIDQVRSEFYPDLEWTKETHITLLYVGKYNRGVKLDMLNARLHECVAKHMILLSEFDRNHLFVLKDIVYGEWSDVTFGLLEPANQLIATRLQLLYEELFHFCVVYGFYPKMTGATPTERGSWHFTIQFSKNVELEKLRKVFKPWIGKKIPIKDASVINKDLTEDRPIFTFDCYTGIRQICMYMYSRN